MPERGSLADRIRSYAQAHYIEPARQDGREVVIIRAGDVARDKGFNNRAPAVCSALGSRVFLEQAGLRLLERLGPYQSTTTRFRYEILEQKTDAANHRGGAYRTRAPACADPGPCPEATLEYRSARQLILVSCVKTKGSETAPAKELYTSNWFRKVRACVETTGAPWRILSAQYGLVHPDDRISPYEKTLNSMSVAERQAWAGNVLAKMWPCLISTDTVTFLAGERYREFLELPLRQRGLSVRVPMRGMRQGQQLAWLNACLHG